MTGAVKQADDDTLYLTLDKAAIAQLPAIPVSRRTDRETGQPEAEWQAMSGAAELLSRCRAAGIELRPVDGDSLAWEAEVRRHLPDAQA